MAFFRCSQCDLGQCEVEGRAVFYHLPLEPAQVAPPSARALRSVTVTALSFEGLSGSATMSLLLSGSATMSLASWAVTGVAQNTQQEVTGLWAHSWGRGEGLPLGCKQSDPGAL